MKKMKFLAVVASSLMAFSASAAEPCKAYVKVDLGYSMSSGTRAVGTGWTNATTPVTAKIDGPIDKGQRGFYGSAGVGYAFDEAMRGEVTFDFKPKMKAHAHTFAVETRELGGSAKLIYDFNNNSAVTPFIFAGLGATNITPTVKPYVSASALANPGVMTGTTPNDWVAPSATNQLALVNLDNNGAYVSAATAPLYKSIKMKSKTVMTYQGGFGLSFKGSDVMNVDLTYGIAGKANYIVGTNFATVNAVAAPAATTVDTTTVSNLKAQSRVNQVKFKNQLDQSLTLGVRFTL